MSAPAIGKITGPAHTVTNAWEATRNVLATKENKAGTTVISEYAYGVNDLGQRTGVNTAGTAFAAAGSIGWGYNSKGEVVKADSNTDAFDRAYQFDGIGNRLKSADSLTLPTSNNYTPNALNQYTAIGSLNPAYDLDGNMTSGPLPAVPTANSILTWDGENRLISTTVSSITTTYLYDSQSRRIAQTTGTATTVYVYDGWNPIAEYAQSGTGVPPVISKTYTWGMDLSGSMQGAGGVGGLLAVTDSTGSYFPTFDGNGNISEYLDSTGAIAAHYEYDPFGKTTVATGTKMDDFAHRFSTKPVDSTTGLFYYGYRWYDPATGRWPSRDPIEEAGGYNLYGFIWNDAINNNDYLGLFDMIEKNFGVLGSDLEGVECGLRNYLKFHFFGEAEGEMFDIDPRKKKKLPKKLWSLIGMWNVDLEWKCMACLCTDEDDINAKYVWKRVMQGDEPLIIPGSTFADPTNPDDHWTIESEKGIRKHAANGLKRLASSCNYNSYLFSLGSDNGFGDIIYF